MQISTSPNPSQMYNDGNSKTEVILDYPFKFLALNPINQVKNVISNVVGWVLYAVAEKDWMYFIKCWFRLVIIKTALEQASVITSWHRVIIKAAHMDKTVSLFTSKQVNCSWVKAKLHVFKVWSMQVKRRVRYGGPWGQITAENDMYQTETQWEIVNFKDELMWIKNNWSKQNSDTQDDWELVIFQTILLNSIKSFLTSGQIPKQV